MECFMDKEFRKKLDDYIRVRLTEKRYRHTEGVIYTAVRLAERYGADPEKAEIEPCFTIPAKIWTSMR